jgi:hypothetical protein
MLGLVVPWSVVFSSLFSMSAFQHFSFFPGPDFGLWTLDFARPLSAFQRFSFSRKLPQRSPRKSGQLQTKLRFDPFQAPAPRHGDESGVVAK